MNLQLFIKGTFVAAALVGTATAVTGARTVAAQAQDQAPKAVPAAGDRYTGVAVLQAPGVDIQTAPIDITVDRWTTDEERDKLFDALTQGSDKMLTALQNLPRVGTFKAQGAGVPYELHFARHTPSSDGSEHMTLITDRNIDFNQVANFPDAVDFRFTVMELQIGKDGKGNGRMSVATKISLDKANNTIVLENYSDHPILLQGLHRLDSKK